MIDVLCKEVTKSVFDTALADVLLSFPVSGADLDKVVCFGEANVIFITKKDFVQSKCSLSFL